MVTNPIRWSKPRQIALAVSAFIGAIIAVVVGYLAYAVGTGAEGAIGLGFWIQNPVRWAGLWWGLLGAALGVGVVYVKLLLAEPEETK